MRRRRTNSSQARCCRFTFARRPQGAPAAERSLEVANRRHGDRVDHLLMELRVAFGRGQSVLREQIGVVQIHRRVEVIARRIVVDHLEIFAHRAGREVLPPGAKDNLVDEGRVHRGTCPGVEGVGAQPPKRRTSLAASDVRLRSGKSGDRGLGRRPATTGRSCPSRHSRSFAHRLGAHGVHLHRSAARRHRPETRSAAEDPDRSRVRSQAKAGRCLSKLGRAMNTNAGRCQSNRSILTGALVQAPIGGIIKSCTPYV